MTKNIDEMRAEAEAHWRRQWEQEHERRKEAGLATIRLVPEAEEPPVFSHDFQAEFRSAKASLSENGVQVEAPFMALDAADAVSGYAGELLIPFIQFVGPAVGLVVGAWLQSKAGRKVRIKIGDVEIEATTKKSLTEAELEKILKRALNARAKMDDKS
jgi:hypothetical protein